MLSGGTRDSHFLTLSIDMESFKMAFNSSLLLVSTATRITLWLLAMSHLITVEHMNVVRKQEKAGHITTC